MKASTILIALSTILFCSCGGSKTHTDISGTYVTQFKNEYSIAYDTLIISSYSKSDGIFNVDYKAGFNRIINGKIRQKEFKSKQWKASWDDNKHSLSDSETGSQLKFIFDKHSILDGNMAYHKIKY
jgi:hypothetical protein